MAQKTWVRADEKQAILESAVRLIEDKIDVTAKALIEDMEATTDYPRRGVDTIGNLLAEWRKEGTLPPAQANVPPGEQVNPQEADWSIGTAAPHLVPPEALPTICKLWDWCVATGRRLTVRQAKWAAKLRLLPEFQGFSINSKLYRWSTLYARREWTCRKLQRTVITTDLDAELILDWRRSVAYATGALSEPHDLRVLKYNEDQLSENDRESRWSALIDVTESLALGRAIQQKARQMSLPEDDKNAEDWLYAIWLRKLAKGPRWLEMSQEERDRVADRLLQLITEKWAEWGPVVSAPVIRSSWPAPWNWRPTELLKEVGYDN